MSDLPRLRGLVWVITGLAALTAGIGILISAFVEAVDGGDEVIELVWPGLSALLVGGLLLASSSFPERVSNAGAFAAVAWSWVAVSALGAVPFVATGTLTVWHEALFESVSGFTCSGSTVLTDIEGQGAGILFWRSMTQWLGGMGLVVLAVAVFPLLRVGGLELISAEAPGPETDRLSPRIRETAKRLWLVYFGLTVAITAALMVAGMSLFDGVTHAFAAASTGGFSPRNSSVGTYDSVAVEVVLIIAMVIGGASFTLHYRALRGEIGVYRRVGEARLYGVVLLGATGLLTILLLVDDVADGVADAFRQAAFNAATIVSSCGFGTSDFTSWGSAAQFLLVILMVPAGMTGSTSGGMKLLRLQVLVRHALREVVRSRHPQSVVPVRLGPQPVAEDVVSRVIGFAVIYATSILIGGVLVTALGVDLVTGFSGAVSAIGNIGPALGEAGPADTFLVYPAPARGVLMVLMLLGRLELFAVLFMFTSIIRSLPRRGAAITG